MNERTDSSQKAGLDEVDHKFIRDVVEMTTASEIGPLRRQRDCAVRNLRHLSHDRGEDPGPLDGPLWSRVAYVFGVGATTAYRICREVGVDPEEDLHGEDD